MNPKSTRMLPRTVYLLSACNGYLFINQSLLITISALIGFQLADDKRLSTLPLALQFAAVMFTTVPASFFMGRFGRKAGFMLGNTLGITGALIALYSLFTVSFQSFCVATICFGMFAAFGNYYRFTAAELVNEDRKSVAISWVMAGGVLAALIGPNLANWSSRLFEQNPFAGPFAVLIVVYGLSITTLLFARFPKTNKAASDGPLRPVSEIITRPVFIVAVVCQMLGYGTMNLVMTATPLAIKQLGMGMGSTALVIQWHVFSMFAPSFFTGSIIKRIGIAPVLLLGAAAGVAAVSINLSGNSQSHFVSALVLLGISWNFLYVGGTTLLTDAHNAAEKSRTQAVNDLFVFSTVTLTALSAGALHHEFGFRVLNYTVLPLYAITALVVLWLVAIHRRQKPPTTDQTG